MEYMEYSHYTYLLKYVYVCLFFSCYGIVSSESSVRSSLLSAISDSMVINTKVLSSRTYSFIAGALTGLNNVYQFPFLQ